MYNDGYNGGVSSPTLNNVTFSGNQTVAVMAAGCKNGDDGGDNSPALSNVTFSGNTAADNGGGMLNDGSDGTSSPA